MQDSKKRIEKDSVKRSLKDKVDNIKAQDKSYQILYHRFEKLFDKAYSDVIKVPFTKEDEDKKYENKEQKIQHTWRHLDSEDEFLELLEKLGYIDR